MAVKDSGEIATNSNYALGDYSFRIERSSGTSPGYDKIEAICTKDGKNARKSIQVPSDKILQGWFVEANETEATVYAVVKDQAIPAPDFNYITSSGFSYVYPQGGSPVIDSYTASPAVSVAGFGSVYIVFAAETPFVVTRDTTWESQHFGATYTGVKTSYKDKEFYYATHSFGSPPPISSSIPLNAMPSPFSPQIIAAEMVWGSDEGEEETLLVGRFAIDLKDAGGDGPGSDWTDPGDYDPDWEEGDPTHTLYVTVTGALSGRHNDPIVDPSYSYIPADKNTVKDYGCGGDGGHGGGGGAGASTVVIHKFATNQANSKEVTALARRHGYGSGGGKGGKGGDGCILVYY